MLIRLSNDLPLEILEDIMTKYNTEVTIIREESNERKEENIQDEQFHVGDIVYLNNNCTIYNVIGGNYSPDQTIFVIRSISYYDKIKIAELINYNNEISEESATILEITDLHKLNKLNINHNRSSIIYNDNLEIGDCRIIIFDNKPKMCMIKDIIGSIIYCAIKDNGYTRFCFRYRKQLGPLVIESCKED